ncbi:tRNA (uracil(54)-C(5))-methyltransferase [Malassezia sp. CBS 17886]|nr:tRNA (uracil(54)-C(5))-methyltransferase [Malassezia sp. CBS 17886]
MTSVAKHASSGAGMESASKRARTGPCEESAEMKLAAKRNRKRIHYLQKAYGKHVAKHGEPPILFDIVTLLGRDKVDAIVAHGAEFDRVAPFGEEVVVTIDRLSSHGDGIAITPQGNRVLVVPFALPAEVVRVLPYATERLYFKARIVEMIQRNDTLRDDGLVQCHYFGRCGGCQYQMIPYEEQLRVKQRVVENAFANYANLDSALVPAVLPTAASPQTMHYRTKLTPHFDLPAALRRRDRAEAPPAADIRVSIGFDDVTTGRVMDIEECPIGTAELNAALPEQRAKVQACVGRPPEIDRRNILQYKNGATLLLRDTLQGFDATERDESAVVTDHKATVREVVGPTKFLTPAGAFFQNNRSIIPLVVDYVKEQPFLRAPTDQPRHLVDTYCGSGLFALTLAPIFDEVAGVEISASSIECAKQNAALNGIKNAKFLAGNAEHIFSEIAYPAKQTTVVIECTQARDVGSLVRACPSYKIQSVRGFDFFPQTQYVGWSDALTETSHVEGVCILENTEYQ